MQTKRYLLTAACLSSLLALTIYSVPAPERPGEGRPASAGVDPLACSWYFTISGDSRDCGDLIMPKIARHIADHQTQPPVSFYWHLGDFRALYRVDCDMALREAPSFRCVPRETSPDQTQAMKTRYLMGAWDDFKKEQVAPFEEKGIPVFLGIGNHELINRTRLEYRSAFERWLKFDWIQAQRAADKMQGIQSTDGDTYYHFVRNGVDFVYLDNAEKNAFFSQQVEWLFKLLDADAKNDSVKTIIVGMHEALPGSTSSNHAMDEAACADVCAARKVYERLYDAQNLSGPAAKRKNVYLFASHSHYFQENVYRTPEHEGRVIKGWIVGTAGAEQYQVSEKDIRYGYLLVEVRPDGTVDARFQDIKRTDPPAFPDAKKLTDFCFDDNHVPPPPDKPKCPACAQS